jgi:hypothetical protein
LEEALPTWPFRFEKGLQSFADWWYFATTGTHIGFESWLERVGSDMARLDLCRAAAR